MHIPSPACPLVGSAYAWQGVTVVSPRCAVETVTLKILAHACVEGLKTRFYPRKQ